MTRYTATTRRTAGVVRLEVTGERDESSSYRHKWVTRLRLGELTAEGPNTREAVDNLADELRALASCPEAVQALAMARAREIAARAVEATPAPKPEPFERDDAVEVRVGGAEPRWVAGSYDGRYGARFRAYVPEFGGYLTVERSYIRAVNSPPPADVG